MVHNRMGPTMVDLTMMSESFFGDEILSLTRRVAVAMALKNDGPEYWNTIRGGPMNYINAACIYLSIYFWLLPIFNLVLCSAKSK